MVNLTVYLLFLISVAVAAASIILSSRLRNRHGPDLFSPLLYFQVFIYTFGFYGLWGQVLIKTFLSELVSPDMLVKFLDITVLLGFPFLVFGWLMLIRFSSGMGGWPVHKWFVPLFLLINLIGLVSMGYIVSEVKSVRPATLMKYYFTGFTLLYSVIASSLIYTGTADRSVIPAKKRRIIASLFLIITIMQCTSLVLYDDTILTGMIFILLFFTGYSFLPLYINYYTEIPVRKPEKVKEYSYEEFCRKHEISPREAEIIREICNGLSNKEISEKLFISLQTVKDHTHRIYTKTSVKGRSQLIALLGQARQTDISGKV